MTTIPAPRVMSNAVLGMSLFVLTELMFFAALISAFVVIKANGLGVWAPPSEVRLPVLSTAFNTVVLFASGIFLFLTARSHSKNTSKNNAKTFFALCIATGAFFVLVQGYEWVNLLKYGLTMKSGMFGATFFLLIGCHGLHALGAVLYMAFAYWKLEKGQLSAEALRGAQVFWYFVVGIWPIIYSLVYF